MSRVTHNSALTPSGCNNLYQFEGASFADYISWTRQLIEAARVDLGNKSHEDIQKIIDANAPSESYPKPPTKSPIRQGILLIHGLSSSPMGMTSLQQYFSEHGYLVRSVLLPGHGTRPGDLLEVTYQDWLETCRFGIKTLREEVEHVSVIAFSAGALLALYLSLTENSIDSLVLSAPALSLRHFLSSYYISLLHPFKRLSSRINWPILKPETDYAKYHSIPLNAIYQVTQLMKAVHHIRLPLTVPVYIASTTDDETISHKDAVKFFLNQAHPLNRGIIYTAKVNLKNKDALPASLIQRTSCFPEEKILNFSHISLGISPDHFHYGKNGDFVDIIHYHPKKKLPENHHHLIHHGALSKKNITQHFMKRLSYNPDFNYLAADIEKFLKECGDYSAK